MSEQKPLVSVIMPVYNVENYIKRAVDSVTCTDFDDYEIILTNDGSTDSSASICDELSKNNPKIKVIHQENAGVSMARNAALSISRGKYIYFMDPDDYSVGELLKDNILLAEKYNCDQVIFGFVNEVRDNRGRVVSHIDFYPGKEGLYSFDEFKKEYNYHIKNISNVVWNRIYSAKSIKGITFRKELNTAEDAAFNMEVLLNSQTENIYYNNKIYYVYLRRASSLMNDYNPDRFKNEMLITDLMKEAADKWGMEKELRLALAVRYACTMLNEYNNMIMPSCKLTTSEIIKKMKEFNADKRVANSKKIIKPCHIPQLTARICYVLVLLKLYRTAYYFRKFYTPFSVYIHKILRRHRPKEIYSNTD
ncbi:MAG: glycosyltransferase [Ruminococcaceae bacterium]|nr:glycosyltransferase [Oscillospiraceae bacterium]